MPQDSQSKLIKESLRKQQITLTPKLTKAIDEKTKELLEKLGFKNIDPLKADRAAHEIASTACLDVMDNIGRIHDIGESSSVIADSITQSLIAHPLTHAQAMQMNEAEMYRKTEKQIGNLLVKFQIQKDLENLAVLSDIESIGELEKPTTEILAQISNEADRYVEEKSPLAQPSVHNTLKENSLEMTKTYTEDFKGKTKIFLEKGEIPTLSELNEIKTETFNQAASKIFINTNTTSSNVDPKEFAEKLSYVLNLKPPNQNQTETLGLGNTEPNVLAFTKGTGTSGFTVGFGLANNQAAQTGAYNSLLVYDKDWLEKTKSKQAQIVESVRDKKDATPREIIAANYAQKKLDVLQGAQAYQSQNPKLVNTYQEYFQARPAGTRLRTASQAAQATTSAHFNEYRGTWSPRSLSTNTNFLAQKTFGGLAFRFGDSKIGQLSKTMKLAKGMAPEAALPLMIASATKNLMKKMAKGTGLVFGAVALYFMKLGAAALKGFIIGAAIGGTVGAGAGAALGLAIAAPFGPFAPFVAIVTVPLGAVIGGFVGATLGGVAGGLIGYGLASGTTTAVTTGAGTAIGGVVGTYVGATLGAAAVAWIPVIGPFLAPVGALVGAMVGAYVGAAIGAGIGYVVGHYVVGTIGASLTGAATGAMIGFYIAGPPGALIGAGVGYLAAGGWHQVGDFITSSGTATSGVLSGAGSFVASVGSTLWGGISGFASTIVSGAGHVLGAVWGGITSFSFSSTAVAAPILTGIGSVAIVGTVSGIITSTSFFNKDVDVTSHPAGSNIYVTVTKTASPTFISNSSLPTVVNFSATVKASSFKLINVVCTDVTVLKKNDGTERNLATDLVGPICPSIINPDQVLNFNFSTNAENTAEFQNSTIVNDFNIDFDVEGAAGDPPPPPNNGTACSATSGFNQLLPSPIPPSVGAVSPSILSRLLSGQVIPAAKSASTLTGVACELLVGLHYVEASWWDDGSFVSGRTIGQIEPDISIPSDCTSARGTWIVGLGCKFTTLEQSAIYAAYLITQKKMPWLFGVARPPSSFIEMVGVMSAYNGGGNSNCGEPVPYTGPCPPPYYGNDDPYAIHHFDTQHANMYLIFCADYTRCNPPQLFTRDGAATAAKEYYKSMGGN